MDPNQDEQAAVVPGQAHAGVMLARRLWSGIGRHEHLNPEAAIAPTGGVAVDGDVVDAGNVIDGRLGRCDRWGLNRGLAAPTRRGYSRPARASSRGRATVDAAEAQQANRQDKMKTVCADTHGVTFLSKNGSIQPR
jgi:hypothetical protein